MNKKCNEIDELRGNPDDTIQDSAIADLLGKYPTEEILRAAEDTNSTIMELLFEASRSMPPEREQYLEDWLNHSVELMLDRLRRTESKGWVVIDRCGDEHIYTVAPMRTGKTGKWYTPCCSNQVSVPKGTAEKLTGFPMKWDDEPRELA